MRYLSYIITLLVLVTTSGCVDEIMPPCPGPDPNNPDGAYTLTFNIGVPAMDDGSNVRSRAIYYGNPTYYEDWIDTQDGLQVLFFITKRERTGVQGKYDDSDLRVAADPINPLKDYFLFESTSRWVTQLPYDDDNNLRYRVTVPVYQIGDEESEYRDYWPRIRELLRDYDFKVAILANHEATSTVRWTLKNSVLSAPDIDNLANLKDLKSINDIHHAVADKNYNSTNQNRKNGFLMLTDHDNDGAMGPFIDWVTARSQLYGDALGGTFNTRETARVWIRDYWNPDLIYNEDTDEDIDYKTLYHNYRHIWSYWNFGGAAPDNALPYSNKSTLNPHIGLWEERNGALLRKWWTDAMNNNGVLTDLDTHSNEEGKYDGSMPLIFYPSDARAVEKEASNGKRFYGITLPKFASAPTSVKDKDCFHFKLNASGTVTIRYTTANGGKPYVRRGTSQIGSTTSTSVTINGVKLTESTYYCEVLDEVLDGYVYALNGDITIYDIEFAQDEYIYGTDREGILPSSDHPIPMYGVQKFNRLQGFWDEEASFDLTTGGYDDHGNLYQAKVLFLLRAVAKIEVLIPKSLGVPKHVYIHSFNRHVRCEPMDLATPTEELWKDHNNGCEWKAIQARGTMYDGGKYTESSYKKKLGWIYGNWLEWGWHFNGYTQYIPDYEKDGPFPRLFNPYINRAACAACIDVTDYYNDQFYHFLFYMGENTLDSSTSYDGNGGSVAVPNIRIRFDERYAATCKLKVNSDLNLNSNDCYRIYFTEGGIAPGARDANGASKIAKGSYGSYESNADYLKYHWPIMRNHVYRFTVLDIGAENMSGLVVDAQNRSADFNYK